MGIDFRVAGLELPREICPSWAYSGFMAFRDRVLQYFGTSADELYRRPENAISTTDPQPTEGPWTRVPADLFPFINHSDCDGVLTPDECRRVSAWLWRVVDSWPDTIETQYDRQMGLRLVSLMLICSISERTLEFC